MHPGTPYGSSLSLVLCWHRIPAVYCPSQDQKAAPTFEHIQSSIAGSSSPSVRRYDRSTSLSKSRDLVGRNASRWVLLGIRSQFR
ncbi:hypothetical protein FKP32DRAFT_234627 [Trametes sanguinea]|nr:hypothetical protein FKP32DRAFT_234627 [Trametes sanguinea]